MESKLLTFRQFALTRQEVRQIKGGCQAQGMSGTTSKAGAQAYAAATGGHWCCASCNDATWAQQPGSKSYKQMPMV